MSDTAGTDPIIHCAGCGRGYKWAPKVAGKSAMCRCGTKVTMPEHDPRQQEPPSQVELDLGGLNEDGTSKEPVHEDASSFFDEMSGGVLPSRRPKEQPKPPQPEPEPEDPSAPSFVPIPERTAPDSRRCPSCGTDYPIETVVCTACGINLVTGHRLQAEVGEIEEEDFELVEDDPASHRVLIFFAERVPGVFNPMVLAMTILLGLVGLGILGFGLATALVFKVVLSGVAICAAGMVAWGQAMAWLVFGQLDIAINCMVEFDDKKWTVFGLLFFLPLPIFFVVFKAIAEG